jgi:hypothetical protein
VTHRGNGHGLAQWEGRYFWSTIRARLSNAISNWEVPRRRSAAEALWRAGGCAARDDTRFMVFLPLSVQTLNTCYARAANPLRPYNCNTRLVPRTVRTP